MFPLARWVSAVLFALAVVFALPACDGTGIEVKVPDLGESPPPAGGGGGGGGGGEEPPPGDPRFVGTFITSYSDDFAANSVPSPSDYAARIVLEQSGSAVTGTGEMARFFRTGAFNNSQFEFTLGGSATPSGNDGLITFRNRPNRNDFDRTPQWVMRRVGSRIIGIYGEFNASDQLVRSGRAEWSRQEEASLDETWVTTGADSFAIEALNPLDRTTRVALSNPSGTVVEGSGGFTEHPLFGDVRATNVTVIEGGRQGLRVGLRLGGPEMGDSEFQHLGFFSDSVMHTAYGQFLNRQSLERMGASTWVRARPVDASNINGTWIASFSDSRTEESVQTRSYIAVLRLEVAEGNQITGSAHILDETDGSEANFLQSNIVEGTISGSRLRVTIANTRASFEWDLRVGFNRLLGTFRRLNNQDEPTNVGNAVFFRTGAPALEGTWTAAFVDRVNELRPPETQLAVVRITEQQEDGTLTGTGRLQYAAEIDELERAFNVTGQIRRNHPSGPWIQWVWSGSDLAGDTEWNLRQQSNIMVGTYTNYTANGNLESRGHAVWYR